MRVPWKRGKRTRDSSAMLVESEHALQRSRDQLGEARAQRAEVERVVQRLFERRMENSFGESIAQAYRESRYLT